MKTARLEYFVYAIFVEAQTSTVVKIGRAASIRERVSGVRTGCPFPVRLVMSWDVHSTNNGVVVEREAHKLYASSRLNGEWFDPWRTPASEGDIDALRGDIADIIREEARIADPRVAVHRLEAWQGRKKRMRGAVVSEGSAIPPPVAEIFTVGDRPVPPVQIKRRRLFARC